MGGMRGARGGGEFVSTIDVVFADGAFSPLPPPGPVLD